MESSGTAAPSAVNVVERVAMGEKIRCARGKVSAQAVLQCTGRMGVRWMQHAACQHAEGESVVGGAADLQASQATPQPLLFRHPPHRTASPAIKPLRVFKHSPHAPWRLNPAQFEGCGIAGR